MAATLDFAETPAMNAQASGAGPLLAGWRARRGLSQLELSLRSGVSAKHISFIETGRSRASRTMLMDLCEALGVPLRHRNDVLLAGGFAPHYRESAWHSEGLDGATESLRLILQMAEPMGAVVFDRRWDLVMVNGAYRNWAGAALPVHVEPFAIVGAPRPNLVRLLFESPAFRNLIVNWSDVAAGVLARVRADLAASADPHLQELLERFATTRRAALRGAAPPPPLMPIELRMGERRARLVNTISTLGSATDLTLRDLRIEMFHPADARALGEVRAWAMETASGAG